MSIQEFQVTVNSTVRTFRPTHEQDALARRYAIRVTSLGGTRKVASRACKCGRVQEYDFDTVDTPRNRWEAQHSLERLGGDDWRCAVCRMSHVVKDTASGGGNGGGGGKRTHRNRAGRSGDAKVTKRQIEARIKQLADMIANPGANTPDEQIAAWQAEQDALAAVLVNYGRRRRAA